MSFQSETLRKAIENLIDAKLVDAMARPDGLNRLLAHRRTNVASPDIRNAERIWRVYKGGEEVERHALELPGLAGQAV